MGNESGHRTDDVDGKPSAIDWDKMEQLAADASPGKVTSTQTGVTISLSTGVIENLQAINPEQHQKEGDQ